MDFLLNLFTGIASGAWQGILTVVGALVGAVVLYFQGKKAQKQEDIIATQKETIDAYKDRTAVEDAFNRATDDERERMRSKYYRD